MNVEEIIKINEEKCDPSPLLMLNISSGPYLYHHRTNDIIIIDLDKYYYKMCSFKRHPLPLNKNDVLNYETFLKNAAQYMSHFGFISIILENGDVFMKDLLEFNRDSYEKLTDYISKNYDAVRF